jgi:hypothetical protein
MIFLILNSTIVVFEFFNIPIGTSAFEFILYSFFSVSTNDIIGVFALIV